MTWLGLDIGGANLKVANTAGRASSMPFPLWRDPNGLSAALARLVNQSPATQQFALTMTGELCDCYRTKAEGVRHILSAVEEVAGEKTVAVYLVDGRFVSIADARELPALAAASNWRALAQFACRYVRASGALLIDIGSTTTDIIPIVAGNVAACGLSDPERLATRELIYAGVGRTPVCAMTRSLPRHGEPCAIAAEVFSTTADAYLLLGEIAEDSEALWTADGRPLMATYSRQRLARQICADASDCAAEEFMQIARAVRDSQLNELTTGIQAVASRMLEQPREFIVSGGGEFLARAALSSIFPEYQSFSLGEILGAEVSRCAPAYAVAILAKEQQPAIVVH